MQSRLSHTVIVDAGSSGTRLYIYKWSHVYRRMEQLHKGEARYPPPEGTKAGGIHKLVREGVDLQAEVDNYLSLLFKDAHEFCDKNSIDARRTALFFLATAGVRDLESSDARVSLIGCVDTFLSNYHDASGSGSKFIKKECKAITGADEALYGWVAANHPMEGDKRYFAENPVGYVEMGGASAQIVIPLLDDQAKKIADEVVETVANAILPNPGETEVRNNVNVGRGRPMSVFLGSYPLGADKGHDAYTRDLLAPGDAIHDGNIYYDPSKRHGYEATEGDATIKGSPDLKTLYSNAETAREGLDPNALLRLPLDDIVRKLTFVGGANFWWSTRDTFKGSDAFSFSSYYRQVRESSKVQFDGFRPEIRERSPQMKKIIDNSLFTAVWIVRVLAGSFGIIPADDPENKSKNRNQPKKELQFKPYAGSDGPDMSWTRGRIFLYEIEQGA